MKNILRCMVILFFAFFQMSGLNSYAACPTGCWPHSPGGNCTNIVTLTGGGGVSFQCCCPTPTPTPFIPRDLVCMRSAATGACADPGTICIGSSSRPGTCKTVPITEGFDCTCDESNPRPDTFWEDIIKSNTPTDR